ncbi:hypothetical protein FPRO06_13005 [Fusarium proliferatum]|nr:hypothetical protein FPRO06_13005 [Fusarium proliferatum]CVL11696.1 uncharacterized protein FPRN_14928 [Fusarium proliferatum]
MGLPPDVSPENLVPIVELGDDAKNVTFNMLCSSLQVIQNTPAGNGFHATAGSWDVWSQPVGEQWHFKTSVDLKNSDIDQELNTNYFNNFPSKKAQIKDKLESLSDTSFSLQQLLFDLDSTVIQLPPTIAGMPAGSDAEIMLQKSFLNTSASSMKAAGEPLLALSARVTSTPDPSQLCMTAFERQVSPYYPGPNASPTAEQLSATTLDFLCMTQGTQPPTAAKFDWNWVQPQDIASESGVVAINRNVFAQYLLDNFILPQVETSCLTTVFKLHALNAFGHWGYDLKVVAGQTPQSATVTDKGANVISINWQSHNDPNTSSSDSNGLFFIKGTVMPNYDCEVSFVDNTIVIEQHLQVYTFVQWDATGSSFYPYDTTITDVYDISVDQNGGLQVTLDPSKHTSVDKSTSPDRSATVNAFTSINDLGNDIKGDIDEMVAADLSSVTFNGPQSFIFPGANTFTYASASFSAYQDLVCDITLVDPATSSHPLLK